MSNTKVTSYLSKLPDADGNVTYTEEENATWHTLITRQTPLLTDRACDEYLRGIKLLDLPTHRIPQCHEISKVLQEITGWTVEPVPALIPHDHFFQLLAKRKFPGATFIRRPEELDYLEEPDMFHEIFGHCPLLTNKAYADFAETYGKLCLTASPEDIEMLARLYWFTIEFGLIKTASGPRIYGGGILSSKNESVYALESPLPQRKSFDIVEVLRTPYRIDIMQPIYFVIDSFDVLFHLTEVDLFGLIQKARRLGMYEPTYLT